ncbi:hypothetical protein KV100_12755 [Mumia sp. zg.B21]|uniref:hypothetical protein n=1 Tax=Mumia sp. zg.B21 TaxID=2855447 RepID=UPI001C6EAA5C|nr:hypothetical protein [Mumia sp. zg.B21]MBW9210524.1 hypothetical protein [Mumia sp. zg.B21]
MFALAVLMSGCGGDPYVAVEAGFRDWLVAVHQRDEAACGHMTDDYRRELAAASTSNPQAADCGRALAALASNAATALPPAEAEVDIPVWDPSGEALVQAKNGSRVLGFWMQEQDGRWLVSGSTQ